MAQLYYADANPPHTPNLFAIVPTLIQITSGYIVLDAPENYQPQKQLKRKCANQAYEHQLDEMVRDCHCVQG